MGRTLSGELSAIHDELRRELDGCFTQDAIDEARFDRFRHALLRHISFEEQVLMPALMAALGRAPEFRSGLRKDHAGIAALCVPLPEREWIENLRDLLDEHYRIEEEPGGFLAACDRLLGPRTDALLERMAEFPAPRLAPFKRGRPVREQLRSVLQATGITGAE